MPTQPNIPHCPPCPGDTVNRLTKMPKAAGKHSLPWIMLRDLEWAASATACYHESHHVFTNFREPGGPDVNGRQQPSGPAYTPADVYSYMTYDFYNPRHPNDHRKIKICYRKLLFPPFWGTFRCSSQMVFSILSAWHAEDVKRKSDLVLETERKELLASQLRQNEEQVLAQRQRDRAEHLPYIDIVHFELAAQYAAAGQNTTILAFSDATLSDKSGILEIWWHLDSCDAEIFLKDGSRFTVKGKFFRHAEIFQYLREKVVIPAPKQK